MRLSRSFLLGSHDELQGKMVFQPLRSIQTAGVLDMIPDLARSLPSSDLFRSFI